MNLHFKLTFGNIVVAGSESINSNEIEGDLVQRMIEVERFLELVMKREVNFEVNVLGHNEQISITKMDQLLDQERQSRNEKCQKCNGSGNYYNQLQRRMESCGMCGGRGIIVR